MRGFPHSLLLILALLACGAGEGDAEGGVLGRSARGSTRSGAPTLEQRARLGTPDSFGSVDGVWALADGRLAVLDGMNSRVLLLSPSGALESMTGRRGRGPEEFFRASRLTGHRSGDVGFLLDEAQARASVLQVVGDSIHIVGQVRLPPQTVDICLAGRELMALAPVRGKLVHRLDSDGATLESFADPVPSDPLGRALSATGELACSPDGRHVAISSLTLGDFSLYTVRGRRLHQGQIPDFEATQYEVGSGIRPMAPERGFVHVLAEITWLDAERVAVQVGRAPPGDGSISDTYIYELDEGWTASTPTWPRIIEAPNDSSLLAIENIPYPVLTVYGG